MVDHACLNYSIISFFLCKIYRIGNYLSPNQECPHVEHMPRGLNLSTFFLRHHAMIKCHFLLIYIELVAIQKTHVCSAMDEIGKISHYSGLRMTSWHAMTSRHTSCRVTNCFQHNYTTHHWGLLIFSLMKNIFLFKN